MQSEWRLQVFSLPFTLHGDATFPKSYSFHREFVSKLENRELEELFPISRLQRASSIIVCARSSVHFAPVRNCGTILSARKC